MGWFRSRKGAPDIEQQRTEALNTILGEVGDELARTGGPGDAVVVALRAQPIDEVLRLTQVDVIEYTHGQAPRPRVFCRTVLAPTAERFIALWGSNAPFTAGQATITYVAETREMKTGFAWDAQVNDAAIDERTWAARAAALDPLGDAAPSEGLGVDAGAGERFPWAGRYVERLDHQLRADLGRKAATFAQLYVFVSRAPGQEISGQVVTTDAAGDVYLSQGHLDHATLDLAVDVLSEEAWSAADNEDVAMVITCDATTGAIERRTFAGDEARRYHVTPLNAVDVVEHLRGA